MKHIFQAYQKKLTNLSSFNRSLFLPRLSVLNDIDLHQTDFLENKPSFSHIESLIQNHKSILICKKNDSRNEGNNIVSNKLKTIQRRSEFVTEERGVHDLYVCWPFVHGIFNDGTPVRCPLILWPVILKQENNNWELILQDSGLQINKSFILAYSHFNSHKINEQLIEDFEADHSNDPLVFRTELFELIKSLGIELQFNRDLFIDKLTNFQDFKRSDFENIYKIGELKLMPEAVLGMFPSFGSFLAPDYDHLIENNNSDNLEDFFLQRTVADQFIEDDNFIHAVKEEQVITPFPIDIFQENILKAVKKGNSIVVQGPPGTGKSQLITNLTADFIARGKKVLVVCEKRVALEVIYERFKQIGINDFVALVHDSQHDRSSLYQKIAGLIQQFDEHKKNTQNINSIRIEQNFIELSRRIDLITRELDDFKNDFYNDHDFGITYLELLKQVDYKNAYIDVNNYIKVIDSQNINSYVQKLNHFVFYIQKLPISNFWNARINFANKPNSFKLHLNELVKDIPTQYQDCISNLGFDFIPNSSKEFLNLNHYKSLLESLKLALYDEKTYELFKQISTFKKDLQLLNKLKDHFNIKSESKTLVNSQLIDLDELILKVETAIQKYKSFFSRNNYQLFNNDYKLINNVLKENNLENSIQGLENLKHLLIEELSKVKLIDEINLIKGLENYRFSKSENSFIAFEINYLIELISIKQSIKELSFSNALIGDDFESLHYNIDNLFTKIEFWKTYNDSCLNSFTESQIEFLTTINQSDKDLLIEFNNSYFDTFKAFDELLLTFNSDEIALSYLLVSNCDNLLNINSLLLNSFSISWKESLEEKYPSLKLYQSVKFKLLSDELVELIQRKTTLSQQVLTLRLQENIHKHVSYNRLSNRTTYRDLLHQVTKKKKVWPLRKLIASQSEDIFKVLPCWLASPETVSSAFPMEQYFDLVIFDEASQCFAERGIPAIFRAKQIIVTGDSQQLSPNDLYKVRWTEEEDDETPELAYESLLELCGRYFKSMMLKMHYRSSNPALIAFSNEHFYHNSLIFSNTYSDKITPIEFKYIENAVWKNRSNQLEAQEVIHLIKDIQSLNNQKTIAVVTFNYHQQELIYSLLQEAISSKYIEFDEHLIVKNIENIQGDERDIVIFSIGYAPDEKGKLQMNFGSLSAENGEKRLNVAITRAKEKIYILSSILPEQLQVNNTLNEGPKLFKKYLEQVKNQTISIQSTIKKYDWSECLSMKFHVGKN